MSVMCLPPLLRHLFSGKGLALKQELTTQLDWLGIKIPTFLTLLLALQMCLTFLCSGNLNFLQYLPTCIVDSDAILLTWTLFAIATLGESS